MVFHMEQEKRQKILELAIEVAVQAHRGQLDKLGRPYITHPLRLLVAAMERGYAIEVQVVAILHDVLEDAPHAIHREQARALARELGVEEALERVTRRADETYAQLIGRALEHPVSLRVKHLDVLDHIREAHTPELQGMVKTRYQKAFTRLASALTAGG